MTEEQYINLVKDFESGKIDMPTLLAKVWRLAYDTGWKACKNAEKNKSDIEILTDEIKKMRAEINELKELTNPFRTIGETK